MQDQPCAEALCRDAIHAIQKGNQHLKVAWVKLNDLGYSWSDMDALKGRVDFVIAECVEISHELREAERNINKEQQ